MNIHWSDAALYFYKYLDHYTFLFPLGIIGIWRWSVWVLKEVVGLRYHPDSRPYKADVSIVTPVYNENPVIFLQALRSWEKNKPAEVIAVIDYTDKKCIEIFKDFAKGKKTYKLIVTKTPGKRPALADGIKIAKSPIVALVDSDTIWAHDVIKNGLPPFNDKKVGGVATYQNVLDPKTFAQKVFDTQLDIRYRLEYPFLAGAGDALVCLSGRTAFYRRAVITPMLHDLVHETFMGRPVISGDDKRLTYLVLAAGWKTAYQSNSHVYTPGMANLTAYTAQRLRWTRNSLRADLRAMMEGWPFKHPALAFFQIDKVLQSFVTILSPFFLMVSLFAKLWIPAAIIVAWWLLSRTIKMMPHFSRRPKDIVILPGYILYSFFVGVLKIYAFFSLNTQGWITRWDKSRMVPMKAVNNAIVYGATAAVLVLLYVGVYLIKDVTYFKPLARRQALLAAALPPQPSNLAQAEQPAVLGASTITEKDYSTKRYVVQRGETNFYALAQKLNVDAARLLSANIAKIPSWWRMEPGIILTIPGKDIPLNPVTTYTTNRLLDQPLTMTYEKETDTMVIMGRGKSVTLKQIADYFGNEYVQELQPKEWLLRSSLFIGNGVTLTLDKSEVTWLKLRSEENGFAILRGQEADIVINGVKITSWDTAQNDYDMKQEDGRSFIFIKDAGRMDVYDSEIAYLGFPTSNDIIVSPYGISWKMSNKDLKTKILTGEVFNSKFHHNYFGAYTFGATGMTWKENEFYANTRYGLDPHDDSNGFLVENNIAHDNGTHGIIFSKRCIYNIVRNNYSYNNKLHGIMLHEASDYNLVYDNVVTGNTSGIALWRSSNNIVRNNKIEDNRHGVRANMAANSNIIENNEIKDSKLYGVYIYEDAKDNVIQNNKIVANDVGIYVRSSDNELYGNTITDNRTGIYFTDRATGNSVVDNAIFNNGLYGIYSKVSSEVHNFLGNNLLNKNRKDLTAREDE